MKPLGKQHNVNGILACGAIGIAFCCCFLPQFVRAQPESQIVCNDVSRIDFSNGPLNLGGFGLFTFTNGKACGSEAVSSQQDSNCDCTSGKCDWRMQIVRDTPLSPEPGISLRLLDVYEEHLTGSGAWGHLILFECQNGQLARIWDRRFMYGVKFTRKRNGFDLESGYWLPNDPHCCPSRRQTEEFRWSHEKRRYIRTYTAILKRDAQTH